jgi:hypothetical protein
MARNTDTAGPSMARERVRMPGVVGSVVHDADVRKTNHSDNEYAKRHRQQRLDDDSGATGEGDRGRNNRIAMGRLHAVLLLGWRPRQSRKSLAEYQGKPAAVTRPGAHNARPFEHHARLPHVRADGVRGRLGIKWIPAARGGGLIGEVIGSRLELLSTKEARSGGIMDGRGIAAHRKHGRQFARAAEFPRLARVGCYARMAIGSARPEDSPLRLNARP